MHSDLRAQDAFRLTGLRDDAGLNAGYRPALTARVRELAKLRHAFPVILVAKGDGAFAVTLSDTIDGLVAEDAPRAHLERVEREIRGLVARGFNGTLSTLWAAAGERLPGKALQASIANARKRLAVDGPVVNCDARFPKAFVAHAWRRSIERRAKGLREEVAGVLFRLRQILAADEARSRRGVSPARLAETFGRGGDAFDLDSLSALLVRVSPASTLDSERRKRIAALVATLENARLFTAADPEAFSFDRCASALRAFRARETELRGFVAALAMARLEANGAYSEALHGALFRQLHENPLPPEELERLPSYLVTVQWHELDAGERADVEELLCAGIPAKVLVQFDDLLDDRGDHGEIRGVGSHAHALSGAALGLGDVSVLQAPASVLPSLTASVAKALDHAGTALLGVFSGASEGTTLPPYLNAAAALEARVFPAFVYEPLSGDDARLDLSLNPQLEAEWPLHDLEFEDGTLQRAKRRLAFTAADFVAADIRFARHFLPLEALGSDEKAATSSVLVVDENDRLHELLVDDQVAIQARRCASRWRHLKRLAFDGVAAVPAVAPPPPAAPEPAAKAEAPAPVAAPAPAKAASSDEAYVETPRCTTCNECTQINPRLFAYDANKQAYIADITAGTYRQLVEAAESCQVSIIHPGKPRDPAEPGIEELLERALPFL